MLVTAERCHVLRKFRKHCESMPFLPYFSPSPLAPFPSPISALQVNQSSDQQLNSFIHSANQAIPSSSTTTTCESRGLTSSGKQHVSEINLDWHVLCLKIAATSVTCHKLTCIDTCPGGDRRQARVSGVTGACQVEEHNWSRHKVDQIKDKSNKVDQIKDKSNKVRIKHQGNSYDMCVEHISSISFFFLIIRFTTDFLLHLPKSSSLPTCLPDSYLSISLLCLLFTYLLTQWHFKFFSPDIQKFNSNPKSVSYFLAIN